MTRFATLLTLAACGGSEPECDVAATARELAGPDAADCGTFAVGADPTDGWSCAVAAFEAGEPAWLIHEESGTDSHIVQAFVFDGTEAWLLQQDQYGPGPWGVDGWECAEPSVATQPEDPYDASAQSGYPIVTCGSLLPEGNHYQVCGEICAPETCQPVPLAFPG